MRTLPLCAAVALAVVLGCGGPAVSSKPLDSVKATPVNTGPTTLSGKLLGHDGKPMALAHVHAGGSSLKVADDGTFRIEVDEPFARAKFTGVDHAELDIPLITADGSVEVEVRLGTYERPAELEELGIAIYELPVPEGQVPRSKGTQIMKPEGDGVFTAEVESNSEQVGYHVIGVAENRNVNGPQSDSFEYDNGGDYISVVAVHDGVAKIRVDTKSLGPGGLDNKVVFAAPESTAARVARVFLDMDHSGWRTENNEWVKTAKLMVFLSGKSPVLEPESTDDVIKTVIEEVPTDSPLWAARPNALFAIALGSDKGIEYAMNVAESIRDRNTAAGILFSLLFTADRNGNVELMKKLRTKLEDDYSDTAYAGQVDRFDPDRAIMAGKPLPDFDYEEWGGARRISPATFKGKEVMIEFWATWCKPCISEMDKLHALWDEKKGTDFALLSININDSAEAMDKFRKDKWPMPWTNVHLDASQSADAMKLWEIVGIPKKIKADKKGVIREVTVGSSM